MNSFSLVSAVPDFGESAEQSEAIGASLRIQARIFKSCNRCQILHSEAISIYHVIVIRILRPFKNDRQIFNTAL